MSEATPILTVISRPIPAASSRLKMSIVKPPVAKARAPKALHDVGASPDSLPDKLRLKVFNHEKNRTLIQAEDP